jgi:hypothetical protein
MQTSPSNPPPVQVETDEVLRGRIRALASFAEAISQPTKVTSTLVVHGDSSVTRADDVVVSRSASGDEAESDPDLAVSPGHRSHQAVAALVRDERDRPGEVELCAGRFFRADETHKARPVFFQAVSVEEDFETGEISLYLTGPVILDEEALDGAAADRNDTAVDEFRQVLNETPTLHDVGDRHLNRLNLAGAVGSSIADGWALFLCRRPSAYVEFARKLAASTDDPGRSLPGALLPFVAYSPSTMSIERWSDSDAASARYPMPSNREQARVLEYLSNSHCVAVQGPPGTGKSYAIRNLLTHLLSQGKRVLVTSQKAQALNVLVREGMAAEIAQLCFVVTDRTPKGRKAIKDQIELLQRGLQAQTDQRRQRGVEVDQLRDVLAGYAALDTAALRALQVVEQFERSPLSSPLGPLTPADLAARVGHLPTTPDPIGGDTRCPLTDDELREIDDLRTTAPPEMLVAAASVKPIIGGLDAVRLQAEWVEAAQLSELLKPHLPTITDLSRFAALPADTIESIRKEVMQQRPNLVGMGQGWLTAILSEGAEAHSRWADFTQRRRSEMDVIADLASSVEGIDIDTADVSSEADLLKQLVRVMPEEGSRWQLFRLTRNGSPVALVRVNGARPTDWTGVGQVDKELRRRQLTRASIMAWNTEVAAVYDAPEIREFDRRGLRLLAKYSDEVEGALSWVSGGFTRTNDPLRTRGLRELQGPSDLAGIDAAVKATGFQPHAARYALLTAQQRARSQSLRSWSSECENHPAARELLVAHDACDVPKFAVGLGRVLCLNDLRPGALRSGELLGRLRSIAPRWAADIAHGAGIETVPTLPWNRQRCLSLLSERAVHRSIPEAPSLVGRDETVARLAYLEAWCAIEQRLGDAEIRSLHAWARALRSKTAVRQTPDAKQEFADALQMLPAVIMPIEDVVRTFDPSTVQRFDVIIIDESSQCGIGALAVLGLADRAVIVGDDQQISPSSVSQVSIDAAQRKYLGQLPTANALGRATSLYDAAHCCVPTKSQLELVEHFRCDPSIIEFSNRLSYEGRIRPLRVDDVVNPVRSLRVDGTRTANDVNEAEAMAVACEVTAICESDPGGSRSIGVIPFISSNVLPFRRRVLELLRIELGDQFDDEVRRRKLEIKSAWEFQGDERDTIFICLIIDKKSRAMWSDSSRQRINVAASRARDSLVVVHSVDTSDLHGDDVRAQLLRHCATYEGAAPMPPDSPYLGLSPNSRQEWLTSIPSKQLGLDAIRVDADGRRYGLAIFGPAGDWPSDRAERVHRARSLRSLDGGVEIHVASELVRVALRERQPLAPPSLVGHLRQT